MRVDFEHLKKLCLCRRFKTKGFDYSEEHPELGKAGAGKRWAEPRDQIQYIEEKYKELEDRNKELESALKILANQMEGVGLAFKVHGNNLNAPFFISNCYSNAETARSVLEGGLTEKTHNSEDQK